MSSTTAGEIRHDETAGQFEMNIEGSVALLAYRITDGTMDIRHTEVPAEFEGEGVGGSLVRAALDFARGRGLRVRPSCPFASAYIRRHAEYQDLVGE